MAQDSPRAQDSTVPPARIDADDIADRVIALPVPEARYSRLRAVKGGLAWLRLLDNPDVVFRFDVVEVVWPEEGEPRCELIEDAFELSRPYIY